MDHGAIWTGPLLHLGGSLVAVLALAGYVHWLWDRRARRAGLDRDAALAIFGAEHPEVEARDALVTADGHAAIVRLADDGRLGLVAAFGARWRTRVIAPRDATLVERPDGGLRLALREIAQPPLVLRFADDVSSWLAPLRAGAR